VGEGVLGKGGAKVEERQERKDLSRRKRRELAEKEVEVLK